jgi:hypothetical protein
MTKLPCLYAITSLCLALSSSQVQAEPTSGPLYVTQLRPYGNPAGSGIVFVYFNAIALCGTSTMSIDLAWGAGKEMYATLQAAAFAGKQVKVELSNSTGCDSTRPWDSKIQSVYVVL